MQYRHIPPSRAGMGRVHTQDRFYAVNRLLANWLQRIGLRLTIPQFLDAIAEDLAERELDLTPDQMNELSGRLIELATGALAPSTDTMQ